jgi:putative endonuclease
MSFYTYILKCSDGSLYTGYTDNPEKRLAAHNEGKASKYTRSRLPAEMVHVEEFETKNEAMSREAKIKRLPREKKFELITCHCGLDPQSLTDSPSEIAARRPQ